MCRPGIDEDTGVVEEEGKTVRLDQLYLPSPARPNGRRFATVDEAVHWVKVPLDAACQYFHLRAVRNGGGLKHGGYLSTGNRQCFDRQARALTIDVDRDKALKLHVVPLREAAYAAPPASWGPGSFELHSEHTWGGRHHPGTLGHNETPIVHPP